MASRTPVLLAFALLFLAPAALAQVPAPPITTKVTATVTARGDPIPLETDVAHPYTIEYTYGPNAGDLPVRLTAEGPGRGWLITIDPPEHATPSGPNAGATTTFEGVVRVRHDGTPIAFQPQTITIRVDAPGDGRIVQATSGATDLSVSAAYRPGLQVVAQASGITIPERGGAGTLYAEMRNTANGQTRVDPSFARVPEGCRADNVMPVTIGPGERANLRIDVVCENGWTPGAFQARLKHGYALDPTILGEPVDPVWDMDHGDGGSFGGPRTFGDEPRDPKYDASWGATLLVPSALAIAAFATRRRYR